MKIQIFSILFTSLLVSPIVKSQTATEKFVKEGDTFSYAVDNFGMKYNFILDIVKCQENVVFNWKMTHKDNFNGTITMNSKALNNAVSMKSYYSPSIETLNDTTSVWVSRKVFGEVKKNRPITINLGDGNELLSFKSNQTLDVISRGSKMSLNVMYCETDKNHKLWILDNPAFPLVIKMDLGWTIELKEINSKK